MVDDESKGTISSPEPENSISDVEKQRIVNELGREMLQSRAWWLNLWLTVAGLVLTFFGIVVAVTGLIGYQAFEEIEEKARSSSDRLEEMVDVAQKRMEEVKATASDAKEQAKEAENTVAAALKDAEQTKQNAETTKRLLSVMANDRQTAKKILVELVKISSSQMPGQKVEAITAWRNIAKITEGIDNNLAARAWFSIGYHLGGQGKHKETIAAYTEAIRLNPKFAAAYNNRGLAEAKMKRYQTAIGDYNKALHLNPNLAETYNNRGNAMNNLGQKEAAIADFDEAIRLKPNYATAYNGRGFVKNSIGRYEDAISDFNEAIRFKPGDEKAYYNQGVAKVRLGRKDEARKDFTTSLNLARATGNAVIVILATRDLKKLSSK